MADDGTAAAGRLEVLDGFDHPHGGRILRVRVADGDPPTIGRLRQATLRATSPAGESVTLQVSGFPVMGGRPSDRRIRASRRVDLVVGPPDAARRVRAGWHLAPENR